MSYLIAFGVGALIGVAIPCLLLSPVFLKKYADVNETVAQNWDAMKAVRERTIREIDSEYIQDKEPDSMWVNNHFADIMLDLENAESKATNFANVFVNEPSERCLLKALVMYIAFDDALDVNDKNICIIYDLLNDYDVKELASLFDAIPEDNPAKSIWNAFQTDYAEQEDSAFTGVKEKIIDFVSSMAEETC